MYFCIREAARRPGQVRQHMGPAGAFFLYPVAAHLASIQVDCQRRIPVDHRFSLFPFGCAYDGFPASGGFCASEEEHEKRAMRSNATMRRTNERACGRALVGVGVPRWWIHVTVVTVFVVFQMQSLTYPPKLVWSLCMPSVEQTRAFSICVYDAAIRNPAHQSLRARALEKPRGPLNAIG